MVAPLRISESKIHAFVKSQQDWVMTTVDKIAQQTQNIARLAPEKYVDGVTIPFQGQQVGIQIKPTSFKKIKIELNRQKIMLHLPVKIPEAEASEQIRLALIACLKSHALQEVKNIVDKYAWQANLYPRFIRIKTQKTRWGSCGAKNDINLNWLLILAPKEVMEYVVVHELCHIKERNHSSNFWQLVEAHLPDYKIQRKWLKHNGRYLMQGL